MPPEGQEDGARTPRKRQAEQKVFLGTPERGSEPRSSRVRQVRSSSEGQGMPSMPSMPLMPVGMRGSSSVPVGSLAADAAAECFLTNLFDDPLIMFMQQQSQQNVLMMQQMMQMTTVVVQALKGLSAGAPPGGERGCLGRSEWW